MKNNYFINLIKKQLIKSQLRNFYIYGGYEITDELVVNFKGNLSLTGLNLKKIPFKIGAVNGNFNCSENRLKNLKNGPDYVKGDYLCDNNKLTSLEGMPSTIGGTFSCAYNQLKSLRFGPSGVGKSYYCNNNLLESLENTPKILHGDLYCMINNIKNLKGCPTHVFGIFNCQHNALDDLTYLPEKVNIFRYDYDTFDFGKDSNMHLMTLEGLKKLNIIKLHEKLNNEISIIDNTEKTIKNNRMKI